MVTIERFSQMVAAIHAASVEPGRWVDAMALVRTTLGGNATGLVRDRGADRVIETGSFADDDAVCAYRNYYRHFDYVLAAVETSAQGLVHSGESLVALNPRSEFNADWMRRYGLDDGLFVRLGDLPWPCSFVVAGAKRCEPFADTDNLRVLNALVPQLQHALATQHTLARLRDRVAVSTHPADSFAVPAMAVTADMAITYHNAAAEPLLRCGTALVIAAGRVRLAAPAADTQLRRAVSHAARDTGTRTANTLRVPRTESARPLILHVLPLGEAPDGTGRAGALVVVVDPDKHREPPKQALRRMFSLTDSETEVALRIARGLSLSAVAEELSLSLATVKTHLQHVYQKTDTHRQAELVRLILTVMP